MLSLLIKLTKVFINSNCDGESLLYTATECGPVWVNAEHILQLEPFGVMYDEELGMATGEFTHTRISLGDEAYAYVLEKPEAILVLIDQARSELTS